MFDPVIADLNRWLEHENQIQAREEYREALGQEILGNPKLYSRLAVKFAKSMEDDFIDYAVEVLEQERSTIGGWGDE